jgi:O-methyltransferase involved in polyketide biosynthesis
MEELPDFDISVAHPARVYNYWLGGKDHFAVDRETGDRAIEASPGVLPSVRANRAFLGKAVRYLAAEAGIRQFLDLGTGLPSANNTHEVAQSVEPSCRVVYVDNDPIVLTHARALLTSATGATQYVDSDVRDPGKILEVAARTLDFSQPIAVMLLMILQYVPDADEPDGIVARLMDAVPSGSYLASSDSAKDTDPEDVAVIEHLNKGLGPTQLTLRTREQISERFGGLELVDPGLVPLNRWRPDPGAADLGFDVVAYGGIGRKPGHRPVRQ